MPVEFVKITPGKQRKVRITAPTRIAGRHVEEGQVIETEEREAYTLVHMGKAVFYAEPAPPAKPAK